MAQIDKNPRQITRLRVEDQKRLEDLATEVVYNKDTDTTEIGTSLDVKGDIIISGAGMIISPSACSLDLTDGSAIYLNGSDVDNNYIEFILDGTTQTALTNKNVFRHQLTLSSATNTYVGVIYLLDNTPITSTQLLTTHTKAFNGYIFLAVKVTGPVESQYAIGIGYTNNKWATTNSDAITNVSDVVTTI